MPLRPQREPSYPLPGGAPDHAPTLAGGHGGTDLGRVVVDDVAGGQGAGLFGGGAGRRHEYRLAVVAQLGDRRADVGEGTLPAGLGRGREVGPGEPPAGELLDGGDVDDPVV